MIRLSIVPIFLLITTLAGCSSSDNTDLDQIGMDINYSIISEGNLSNIDSELLAIKRTEIYQSQQQLDSAMGAYLTDWPLSMVDFESSQAVLITLGIQTSIGNSFRVDSAISYDDYVSLNVTYEASEPGCPQLGAISHPYKLMAVNSRKVVVINESFELQACIAQ